MVVLDARPLREGRVSTPGRLFRHGVLASATVATLRPGKPGCLANDVGPGAVFQVKQGANGAIKDADRRMVGMARTQKKVSGLGVDRFC